MVGAPRWLLSRRSDTAGVCFQTGEALSKSEGCGHNAFIGCLTTRETNMARKNQDSKVQVLRSVPLFAGCTDKELKEISKMTKEVEFPEGRQICKQGQTGLGLHVITDGETRVVINGRTRRRLGPGAFFGEMAVLDNGPRTADVIAESPVSTLSLSAWDFKDVVQNHPSIAVKVLQEMSSRLRDADSSVTA
jgi:CRP/FNR family transcriptional regulator, cyclic AMP receptor protein